MKAQRTTTGLLRGVRHEVHSLIRLNPSPSTRVWIALRAAISMAAPFALLTALGHQHLGLQVSAGAFTALYAANANAAERAKVLPFVGAGLLSCAALGTLLAPWLWIWAIGLVLVAVAVSIAVFSYRLGPPGSVFFVLVYGLAANAMAVVDGERISSPLTFLVAVACGIVFSIVVALVPLLRRAERRAEVRTLGQLLPGPWMGQGEWELLMRVLAMAILATVISVIVLDPQRAYWTVASGLAIIGLRTGRAYTFGRGLHRMVGTLFGAVLFVAIAPLGEFPWLLVAFLGLFQFIIEIFVVRNYALALVFITPLVLFIIGSVSGPGDLFATAGERVIDTIVGAVLAILAVLLINLSKRQAAAKP